MKVILVRAARTYVQAVLGFLLASNLMDLNIASAKVIGIAALPALLSSLQNSLEEHGVKLGPRG